MLAIEVQCVGVLEYGDLCYMCKLRPDALSLFELSTPTSGEDPLSVFYEFP